jgi:hypothetical protein
LLFYSLDRSDLTKWLASPLPEIDDYPVTCWGNGDGLDRVICAGRETGHAMFLALWNDVIAKHPILRVILTIILSGILAALTKILTERWYNDFINWYRRNF